MDAADGSFEQRQAEPMFIAVPSSDPDLRTAYARAAATISQFIERVERDANAFHSAKLRFRDPDESARLGRDQFVFLWLTGVHYHTAERVFSGTFSEVPAELQKWHKAGDRLAFDPEDVFDWMTLTTDGRLFGGYTLRVTRSKLPEEERAKYDRYIGVTAYEPDV